MSGFTQFSRCFNIPPIPKDGAISGWIMQVAAARRIPVRDLVREWKYPIRSTYEADFSREIPPLSAMASMTLESPEHLASYHRHGRTLLGDHRYAFLSQHRDGAYVHYYCPACLAENPSYIRLKWRLGYQFLCEHHHILLLDRCPNCMAAIDFSTIFGKSLRTDPFALLGICQNCQESLQRARRITPPQELAGKLTTVQNTLHQLTTLPTFRHPRAGVISSAKVLDSFLLRSQHGAEVSSKYYIGLNYRRLFLNQFEDAHTFFQSFSEERGYRPLELTCNILHPL